MTNYEKMKRAKLREMAEMLGCPLDNNSIDCMSGACIECTQQWLECPSNTKLRMVHDMCGARCIEVDGRYLIHTDNGVVYDELEGGDIPMYVFEIRDRFAGIKY